MPDINHLRNPFNKPFPTVPVPIADEMKDGDKKQRNDLKAINIDLKETYGIAEAQLAAHAANYSEYRTQHDKYREYEIELNKRALEYQSVQGECQRLQELIQKGTAGEGGEQSTEMKTAKESLISLESKFKALPSPNDNYGLEVLIQPQPPQLTAYKDVSFQNPLKTAVDTLCATIVQSENTQPWYLFDMEFEYQVSERLWYGLSKLSTLYSSPFFKTTTASPDTSNNNNYNNNNSFDLRTISSPGSALDEQLLSNSVFKNAVDTSITPYHQWTTIQSKHPLNKDKDSSSSNSNIKQLEDISKATVRDIYNDPMYFIMQHGAKQFETVYPTLVSTQTSVTGHPEPRTLLPSDSSI
jgi:hypothetical protein